MRKVYARRTEGGTGYALCCCCCCRRQVRWAAARGRSWSFRKNPDAKAHSLHSALAPCLARPERFAEQPTGIWSFLNHTTPPLLTTGHHQPTRQNGTSRSVAIDATVHLRNEALIQCRFATEQPASTAQSLLARAAATSASLSRTPARLPRPSTAGSSSAPSPTSEMSWSTRRQSP
jgi:hypothetical protein